MISFMYGQYEQKDVAYAYIWFESTKDEFFDFLKKLESNYCRIDDKRYVKGKSIFEISFGYESFREVEKEEKEIKDFLSFIPENVNCEVVLT